MNRRIFVICPSYKGMLNNYAITKDCSEKYIGSGWMYEFYKIAQRNGYDTLTSDKAVDLLEEKPYDYDEIFIIAEGRALGAEKLENMGGLKWIYVNQENPVFDPLSYSNKIIDGYHHTFLYHSLHGIVNNYKYLHSFVLPGLSAELDISYSNSRKDKCVIISSNKYHPSKFYYKPRKITLKTFKKALRHYYEYLRYPVYRKYISELTYHQKYKILENLAQKGLLDIYGSGWDDFSEFPDDFKCDVELLRSCWKGRANDKIQILSLYKYCLAIENTYIDGIVTEKLYDGLTAKCYVFYLGSSRVKSYIDSDKYKLLNSHTIDDECDLIIREIERLSFSKGEISDSVDSITISKIITADQFAKKIYEYSRDFRN